MKRHAALLGLSRDHHLALVIANRAKRASGEADGPSQGPASEIAGTFYREIEPHFQTEENGLLPALEKAGQSRLVTQTLAEHKMLRELAGLLEKGGIDMLHRFGELLDRHVRFEERELFPMTESVLTEEELDGIASKADGRSEI